MRREIRRAKKEMWTKKVVRIARMCLLRPRDEGSRDMNQGPESGSSGKSRVSQSGCFVNGKRVQALVSCT